MLPTDMDHKFSLSSQQSDFKLENLEQLGRQVLFKNIIIHIE